MYFTLSLGPPPSVHLHISKLYNTSSADFHKYISGLLMATPAGLDKHTYCRFGKSIPNLGQHSLYNYHYSFCRGHIKV